MGQKSQSGGKGGKKKRDKKCKPPGVPSKGVHGGGGKVNLSYLDKTLLGGGALKRVEFDHAGSVHHKDEVKIRGWLH